MGSFGFFRAVESKGSAQLKLNEQFHTDEMEAKRKSITKKFERDFCFRHRYVMDELRRIAFDTPFRYDEARRFVGSLQTLAVYVSVVYIVTIFSIKFIMDRCKPFQLTSALNIWNTGLALFSILGSYYSSAGLFTEIRKHGLVASYTKIGNFFEGTSGYWTWLFCLSKFVELGDTIFIVLRKKPLVFLHWYHHVLTLNYGIISYSQDTPYNTWIIWLNFTVHSFMYGYYFLRSIHVRVPTTIARSITSMQLLQFLITLLILVHVGYLMFIGEPIDGTLSTFCFCVGMEISYIVLFANFFYQSYVKGGGRKFKEEKLSMKND